jgi:two-component system cell cycle response regulator
MSLALVRPSLVAVLVQSSLGARSVPRAAQRWSVTCKGRGMQQTAVLIVDDEQDIRELVMELLVHARMPCLGAASGAEAIDLVRARPDDIDVIVLDVNMPGMDGTEVLAALQGSPSTAHIPVIMVTAKATADADIVRGVEGGATDYLRKPCSPAVLLAKVRATRGRALAQRSLRVALEASVHSAMLDPLTGLFNRRHFDARIAQAAAHAKRHDEPFAMVMLDIDHFKSFNDTFGHEEGDAVLVAFAQHVAAVMRADDVAFRYGGEEFALLLSACDAQRAKDVAARLRARLRAQPHRCKDGSDRVIAFSAGVSASLLVESHSAQEIVSRADQALYAAKASGRDQVQSWHDVLRSSMLVSHAK